MPDLIQKEQVLLVAYSSYVRYSGVYGDTFCGGNTNWEFG